MTEETQNTDELAADTAGGTQDASATDPAPETAADAADAPDPAAAPAEPIVEDTGTDQPVADVPATDPDAPDPAEDPEEPDAFDEFDEVEPTHGTTYHAKHGIQAAPADHPRTRHTKYHA
jgi:hypothetical protein